MAIDLKMLTGFSFKIPLGNGEGEVVWNARSGLLVFEPVRTAEQALAILGALGLSPETAPASFPPADPGPAQGPTNHAPEPRRQEAPKAEPPAEVPKAAVDFESLPATGTMCEVCDLPQRMSLSGATCPQGHSGAEGTEPAPAPSPATAPPPAARAAPPAGDDSAFGAMTQLRDVVKEVMRRGASNFAEVKRAVADLADRGACPLLIRIGSQLDGRLTSTCTAMKVPGTAAA